MFNPFLLNLIVSLSVLLFIGSPLVFTVIFILITRKHSKKRSRYENVFMMLNVPDTRIRLQEKIYIISDEGGGQKRKELGIVEAHYDSQVRVSLLGDFQFIDENTIREISNTKRPSREYKIGEEIVVIQSGTKSVYARIVNLMRTEKHVRGGIYG